MLVAANGLAAYPPSPGIKEFPNVLEMGEGEFIKTSPKPKGNNHLDVD